MVEKKQILKLLAGVIIALTISVFVLCILIPALDTLEEVSGLNDIENKTENTDSITFDFSNQIVDKPIAKYTKSKISMNEEVL